MLGNQFFLFHFVTRIAGKENKKNFIFTTFSSKKKKKEKKKNLIFSIQYNILIL